mgnify:CR=1 FL=1
MLFKDASFNQNFNFNMTGGSKKLDYFLNATAYNENGIVRKPDISKYDTNINAQKYLFQANVSADATPTTRVSLKMNTQLHYRHAPIEDVSDLFKYALTAMPSEFPATLPGESSDTFTRFGVTDSSLWAAFTTAASNGSVNAMHDSLTPLGGMLVLFNMLLGEIIYGGVGSGLYGMILFILLTVFIAGLMVGRTPDYLGKRIEGREITWCMVALLACATPILCFSAVAAVSSWGTGALNNAGAHGLSEILYAFTSGAQNNGSAFAGLSANVPVWNVLLALAMFIGRFGVMLSMLVVAGSLAARKKRPISDSSFPVEGPTFGLLLLGIIFIVGALTYLPALSLGPIVEQFQMMRGMMF